MEYLFTTGTCTIPTFTGDECVQIRRAFDVEVAAWPERLPGAPVKLAIGTFNAIGMPSSLYGNISKRVRAGAYARIRHEMRAQLQRTPVVMDPSVVTRADLEVAPEPRALNLSQHKIEFMLERMSMFLANDKTSGDKSMARNHVPASYVHEDDVLVAGWVNLSEEPQSFWALDGQFSLREPTGGKTDLKGLSKDRPQLRMTLTNVEPGECLLYVHNIVHATQAAPLKHDSLACRIAFRLTTADTPMIETNIARMAACDPVLTPCGTEMRVFSHHLWMLDLATLMDFSAQFQPALKAPKSGKRTGTRGDLEALVERLREHGVDATSSPIREIEVTRKRKRDEKKSKTTEEPKCEVDIQFNLVGTPDASKGAYNSPAPADVVCSLFGVFDRLGIEVPDGYHITGEDLAYYTPNAL